MTASPETRFQINKIGCGAHQVRGIADEHVEEAPDLQKRSRSVSAHGLQQGHIAGLKFSDTHIKVRPCMSSYAGPRR